MRSYSVFSYTEEAFSLLPPRPENGHKGTFGHVLCVCGSEGMCGAAYLAAKAAYRMGAGLVRILTVEENRPVLQTLLPEALVTVYDGDRPDPNVIAAAEEWADVLVIGCGLGTSASARTLLSYLLRHSAKPRVLDADALNLLSHNPTLLHHVKGAILTPHAMEMSRLTGHSVEELLSDPPKAALELASRLGAICVLKGHHTVVSDGNSRVYRNTTGNSGMATGGSGDVLAGMIGGLLAQSRNTDLPPFAVATLAVYLHGLAGDLAAQRLGEYSLMASDLIESLPALLMRRG